MKYVAFIDTLGFKFRLGKISHQQAIETIRLFNQSIFNLWEELGFNVDGQINGRTFSDSLIIHSSGRSIDDLKKVLEFLVRLYKISITTCNLPLRGGIALGDFDDIQAVEFDNLRKGLVVGQGFIEAYQIESSNGIKGSKILFGNQINAEIEKHFLEYQTQKVKLTHLGEQLFELKWANLDYLRENNYAALEKFIQLAVESKWLDHYYGSLETFLIKESTEDKKKIFIYIIDYLKQHYKYNELDSFIENYIKSDSAMYTKKSLLAFLREKI